jgi:hypothetical protein
MGAVRPFRQAGEMWYLQDSSARHLRYHALGSETLEELVIQHDGVSLAATYSPGG